MSNYTSTTDFDSDDDNDDKDDNKWASLFGEISDDGLTESASVALSSASTLALYPTSRTKHLQEFGEYKDYHGWIQCESRSLPGRLYFHNTRSGCNTWCRPISRYANIPLVTAARVNRKGDSATNDLELMTVSDTEKETEISAKATNRGRSIDTSDIVARYYHTAQIPKADDQSKSVSDGDTSESSVMKCPTLCAADFLKTELFVDEKGKTKENRIVRALNSVSDDDASSMMSSSTIPLERYTVPRLKRITIDDQMIGKPRRKSRARVCEEPKSGIIIRDMYGVRTCNYDLPDFDEIRAAVGVKSSRLSETNSEISDWSSPSPRLKKMRSFMSDDSEWCEFRKTLHQPQLSESSSSSSIMSDTTNSNTNRSSSSAVSICSAGTTSDTSDD